jgi:hypothetical protein
MPSKPKHPGDSSGRRRKAKFEREQKLAEARRQQWERFSAKLNAAHTVEDARAIVGESPALEAPGRGFYSNLSKFLKAFKPPRAASCHELSFYVALLERISVGSSAAQRIVISNAIKSLRIRTSEMGCR